MKTAKMRPALRAATVAVLGALSQLALAQEAASPAPAATPPVPAAAAPAAADQLETIEVSGIRESMRDAVNKKRNADDIIESISTKEIGALPDVTIAEELNRLPGVNTTRDRGNASQASVRGMGPRLVLGLVNGREVAYSEPSQDLRWEIYPSEVLSGADVYKTQDAALIPGGIAATIDILTLSPLDYKDKEFTIRMGPTLNSGGKALPDYDPWGYRGSAAWVHHANDDLAFALAVSAQHEKNGFPDFRTFGWNTVDTGKPGDLQNNGTTVNTTWGLVTEVKEVTQDRHALTGSVGWRPAAGVTIKADALYTEYEIKENQFQAWYGNNILGNWNGSNYGNYNSAGSSYQVVNGSVVSGTLVNQWPNYQSSINNYDEKHKLAITGLNGTWDVGDWTHQADLSYSTASRVNQWIAIYLNSLYAAPPSNLTFNVGDSGTPYASISGFDPANPALQGVAAGSGANYSGRTGQSDGPEHTHDHISALALNTTRAIHDSFLTDLKLGTRFADREKDHSNNLWYLCPGIGSTLSGCPSGYNYSKSLANAGLSEFSANGFTAPPLVYGNFNALLPLVYPNMAQPAGSGLPLQSTAVRERSLDAYAKVDFETSIGRLPLNGNLGVRLANVQTESNGFQLWNGAIVPVSMSNTYTDVLPSLNMTLNLSQTDKLRFAAGIGVSRPPLDALVTGYSLGTVTTPGTPATAGGGNPLLKPYKADTLDLSYESYFHSESMFAIAGFAKRLTRSIAAGQSFQVINGQPYEVTDESNRSGGYILGTELTFQTRFFFLPFFLRDFGVYANLALVDSDIHEVAPHSNPYPMVGLAKNTSELDLYYDKDGFESRVALKHHSAFTVAPTWVGTTLKGLAPETTVDASVSYEWNKTWIVRLQGRNLTNEPARFTTDNNPQDLANDGGYQVYGRSYLFDVGYRF